MNNMLVAVQAFALSQIILSIVLLLRQRRKWSVQEWIFFLFLSSVMAYLLGPLAENHWLANIQLAWENTLPGLFWLLCGSIFNDRFKLTRWNVSVVVLIVVLPALARNLVMLDIHLPWWLFIGIPQIVEFILIAAALFTVVQSWKDDLIEMRRDLRFWFCSMAGVYTFAIIAVREVLFPQAQWWQDWQYPPIAIICLATNILLLQYRPELLNYNETLKQEVQIEGDLNNENDGLKPEPTTVEVPKSVIEQLDTLMNEEHIYREMGLTIGQVAERLDLPEYKLRRMINAGLGYRNFNDYLNGFRITEAGQRLADPEQASEAILNIALDTGFRSLSSFNKAFREAFGKTPTEYRKSALTDSDDQ